MAITLIGTVQSGADANGADVTLTFDGSPAEDDVVVVVGAHGIAEDLGDFGPSTAGYTEDTTLHITDGKIRIGLWYKALGATPDATVVCDGTGGSADTAAYISFVLRGVDTSNVIDATTQTVDQDAISPVNTDPPAITTVTDGAWVIAGACYNWVDAYTAGPSGYLNFASVGTSDVNRVALGAASKEVSSAGVEDPGTFTRSGSGYTLGLTAAIRPYVAPSGPQSSAGVNYLLSHQLKSFSAKTEYVEPASTGRSRLLLQRRRK